MPRRLHVYWVHFRRVLETTRVPDALVVGGVEADAPSCFRHRISPCPRSPPHLQLQSVFFRCTPRHELRSGVGQGRVSSRVCSLVVHAGTARRGSLICCRDDAKPI